MELKTFLGGAAAGAVLIGAVWGITAMMAPEDPVPASLKETRSNKGVMDLICELNLDLDGQLALGITGAEPPRMSMAQIDFGKASGWYQGRIAISEGRAGNLAVQGSRLVVERETAGRRERAEFERQWVRVEPQAGERSLIELSGHGRKIEVGRFVRPELRQALAGEIRRALRTA